MSQKKIKGEWKEGRHQKEFGEIEQNIMSVRCLSYNSDYKSVITKDASGKALGATLMQEQTNDSLKPIAFAIQFISDIESNHAVNKLELLAVV